MYILQCKQNNLNFQHLLFVCQVFCIAYSAYYDTRDYEKIMATIHRFLENLESVHPEIMRKPKLHTLLHLPDDMSHFGPAIGFATERLDTFNIIKLEKMRHH